MTAAYYVSQINASGAGRYEFVRWAEPFRNQSSKVVCRCIHDGFEWPVTINNLIWNNRGCPQCSGKRRWTSSDRIKQINNLPNVEFVRWVDTYRNVKSKAVVRCTVDGFEWEVTLNNLLNTSQGCPQCGGVRRWSADERIAQINSLLNVKFVRWYEDYRGARTKCVCRCIKCHTEWVPTVDNLVNHGRGCPACSWCGYNPYKPATLYALRSECGSMVKIGISNNYEQRHAILKRKTPFQFECVELCHGDGSLIATLEKVLHDLMTPIKFNSTFDGSTEWREWDDRLPMWFEMYRSWS